MLFSEGMKREEDPAARGEIKRQEMRGHARSYEGPAAANHEEPARQPRCNPKEEELGDE